VGGIVPFVLALALAAALTPATAVLGARLGLLDRPDGGALKVHDRPVPLTGGLAVVGAAAAALALAGALPPPTSLASVALALAVGTVDDWRPLPVWPRLVGLAAAGAVAAAGSPLGPLGAAGAAGTVLLVLACTNAVNLLDGQDGLAGGLAAMASLGLGLVAYLASPGAELRWSLALAGAVVGFLAWNRPPARVFLGNGGAYAVGAALALLVLEATATDGWRALLACGVVLGVFAFELAFTVVRRARTGAGIATADRLHSYDLAARALGSRSLATVAFLAAGVVATGLGALASASGLPLAAAAAGGAVLAGAITGERLWRGASPDRRREPATRDGWPPSPGDLG
jgi:UDP-GlcNAc:undecaprenyl-phosphate GlcNAc-1-phosphate transferase